MTTYLEMLEEAKKQAENEGQGYGRSVRNNVTVRIHKSHRGARFHLVQSWTLNGTKITKAEAQAALKAN